MMIVPAIDPKRFIGPAARGLLVVVAGLLLVAACVASAEEHQKRRHQHECMHDHPVFAAKRARLLQRRPPVVQRYHHAEVAGGRSFVAQQVPAPPADAGGLNSTDANSTTSVTEVNTTTEVATVAIDNNSTMPSSSSGNTTAVQTETSTPNPTSLATAAPPPITTTASSTRQPLRIVFRYDTLTTDGSFCANIGDTVPDFITHGSTVACSQPTDLLTDDKRSILRDRILPAALARIQAHVGMLYPVATNLVVPSRDICGTEFNVAAQDTISGVPDADLVIYVASVPIPGPTAAFAATCARDQLDRSIIGHINYDTEMLTWDDNDPAGNEELIGIATHEIFHVLGVSSFELQKPGRMTTANKRGKTVTLVQTPSVLAYVRQFTGCAGLDGAELEDEGNAGSSGSHWERKLYMDELMCAVVGSRVSGLSLGFLNDISVGYTIDLAGEMMNWGRDTGCGVHDNRCNTVAGGRGQYFCFDSPTAPPRSQCNADLTGIGSCFVETYDTPLPPQFQYYSDPKVGGPPYMDGCPIVMAYSNRVCNVAVEPTTNEKIYGYTFNTSSRCFNATGVIQKGYASASTDGPRCLEARCLDASTVQFRIQGSDYVTCGAAGTTVAAPNTYNGFIVCPDPRQLCTSLGAVTPAPYYTVAVPTVPAPDSEYVAPPATPSPTTEPPVAAPATGMMLVRGGFVVPGNAFGRIAADSVAWANLHSAVRSDVADMLNVDRSRIDVYSMSVGSLVVNFTAEATSRDAQNTAETVRGFVNIYDPLPRTTVEYQRVSPMTSRLTVSQAAASGARGTATGIAFAMGVLVAVITVLSPSWALPL